MQLNLMVISSKFLVSQNFCQVLMWSSLMSWKFKVVWWGRGFNLRSDGLSSFSVMLAHGVGIFPAIVRAGESFSSLFSSKVISWNGSKFKRSLLALAFTKIFESVVKGSRTLMLELKLLMLWTFFCVVPVAVGISRVISQAGAPDKTSFSTCLSFPRWASSNSCALWSWRNQKFLVVRSL